MILELLLSSTLELTPILSILLNGLMSRLFQFLEVVLHLWLWTYMYMYV